MKRHLSKSRVLNHLQCPKRLYLQTYQPELAEVSTDTEMAFAIGNEVGELARRQHPDGQLIGHDTELAEALRQTQKALIDEPDRPLFEATFQYDGVLVRADLLLPGQTTRHLVEVKSSTSVKPQYLPDCAIQAWVIESAGVPVGKIELEHIDNSFVYPGGGNYDGLFHREDLTEEVRALLPRVPEWIADCRKTLAGSEPAITVGKQCNDPYPCSFITHCQGPQPDYPVTTLYQGRKLIGELLSQGFQDIRDVPPGSLAKPIHKRQQRSVISGLPDIDLAVRELLVAYPFPRFYIDFETVNLAIPCWAGTRPYQQLPFQWSCHVETADGTLHHHEFLGLPPEAPMHDFSTSLIETLGRYGVGPVFVYNRGFESGRLREMGNMFPELAPQLSAIIERLVDLLPITRNHYYHPDMHGSWSLKSVLPTIAPDLDYSSLELVQHGGAAVEAYTEILKPETTDEQKQMLITGLREYCALDTLALVRLARFLQSGANT
jgi:hypothetical protein